MAGKTRHLLERNGRYYARVTVPEKARKAIGKRELLAPLGADRREALRKLPAVVASFQRTILSASRTHKPAPSSAMSPEEIARLRFTGAIALDTEARNTDPRYADGISVDEGEVRSLRRIASGGATNEEILDQLGFSLSMTERVGLHKSETGSPEWRSLARWLALAELQILKVSAFRDEGEFDPPVPEVFKQPVAPMSQPNGDPAETLISSLFDGYRKDLQGSGRGRNAEATWRPIQDSLRSFLAHDRAVGITRKDANAWLDHLRQGLSGKTVRDKYLATARAVFNWAEGRELIRDNPFAKIRLRVEKKISSREQGFNDAEAQSILAAAIQYKSSTRKELKQTESAKRWAPFLAAYTGARIAELTQLRAEDVREEKGIAYIRITPEAGTVKGGEYRDVPLHPHLVELGFVAFAKSTGRGPLFYKHGTGRASLTHPSQIVAARVGQWVQSLKVADPAIAPNHGWRHRFKTVALAVGLNPRVVDAIQGHAARTAGERYGDITLTTRYDAIRALPQYAWDKPNHAV